MKAIWVVVAESARGRIFTLSGIGEKLHEIADLAHSESRLHSLELSSDVPGRAFDSHGQGRHGMEQATEPHVREAQAFAVELSAHIERGIDDKRFDALVLIAPPKFLGRLRSALSKRARDTIIGELGKNLVTADEKSLQRHVVTLFR
jgi:protein required for attachment to host cells